MRLQRKLITVSWETAAGALLRRVPVCAPRGFAWVVGGLVGGGGGVSAAARHHQNMRKANRDTRALQCVVCGGGEERVRY
jgi:hypothetical protein